MNWRMGMLRIYHILKSLDGKETLSKHIQQYVFATETKVFFKKMSHFLTLYIYLETRTQVGKRSLASFEVSVFSKYTHVYVPSSRHLIFALSFCACVQLSTVSRICMFVKSAPANYQYARGRKEERKKNIISLQLSVVPFTANENDGDELAKSLFD